MPPVMKVLVPLRTKWLPSRRAVVVIAATSEPPPGSVMASAELFRPDRISGSDRARMSSEASAAIGPTEIERQFTAAPTPPEPLRASSSL